MKTTSRRALLLASALALGAAWLLLSLQPEVPAAADSNPGDDAARLPQTAEGTARADDTPSMPASDTSTSPASSAPTGAAPDLLAELPVLEQRLADGDIAAGWRAYGKLRECAYRSAAATSAAVQSLDSAQSWQRKNLELLESWNDADAKRYCRGSEAFAARRAFDLLLRLAEMGDLAAQLQFTLDPPIYRRQALAELDLILVYRERAPALLERALEAGSRRALIALLDAHTPALQTVEEDTSMIYHSPNSPVDPANGAAGYRARFGATITYRELPHRQILQPDPATAYRLALVCQRVCTHATWLDHANRTIAATEGSFDAPTRLRQFEAAQALLLDAFAQPADDPPVTAGYWWNAL